MALPDKPDSDMVKKILDEINMTERDLEEAVATMKQWLCKRPHLPPSASDDVLLKAFIIGCKSVEKAKSKVDSYFTYRTTYDHFFSLTDPLDINWKKVTQRILVLPGTTGEGYKVCLVTFPDKTGARDFVLEENVRVFFMMLDFYCREFYMSSGFILAMDLSNLTLELLTKMSISTTSSTIRVLLDAYPMRLKGILGFCAAPLADTFFNTFITPFFSHKMKQRVHIQSGDHSSLEKYFPVEMLPSQYRGGKAPPLDTLWSNLRMRLDSERDWYLKERSQTVNEALRPREDTDQMKGTFRRLECD